MAGVSWFRETLGWPACSCDLDPKRASARASGCFAFFEQSRAGPSEPARLVQWGIFQQLRGGPTGTVFPQRKQSPIGKALAVSVVVVRWS